MSTRRRKVYCLLIYFFNENFMHEHCMPLLLQLLHLQLCQVHNLISNCYYCCTYILDTHTTCSVYLLLLQFIYCKGKSLSFLFVFLFCSVFFKTWFSYVTLAFLKLTLQTRLASSSEICLPLPPEFWNKAVYYHHPATLFFLRHCLHR